MLTRRMRGRGLCGVVVAVAIGSIACLATPTHAQMTPVGPAFAVSGTLLTDAMPNVAMAPTCEFLVAWTVSDDMQTDVFARRFDKDGMPLGTEFLVNKATAGNQRAPGVAFFPDGSGNAVITWTGPDSENDGVLGNIFDANDDPLLPQDAVINPTEQGVQAGGAVSASATGFVVLWGDQGRLFARTFGTSGLPVSGELMITDSGSDGAGQVSMDDTGDFVVVWDRFIPQPPPEFSTCEIFHRRFQADGTPVGAEEQVNAFTIDNQRLPRVEVAPMGGDYLITWDNGDQAMPHFQLYDDAGKVGVERFAAEQIGSFKPRLVDPARAEDGSFATVFETFVSGPGARIDGLLFNAAGDVIDSNPGLNNSDAFSVHDSSMEPQAARNPRIATNGRGLYVVVYDRVGNPGDHVAARLFQSGTPDCSLPGIPSCGDPDGNGMSTAGEALLALSTAVGSGSCPVCLCDIDGSGTVTAGDALAILQAAVGFVVALNCPPCP